MSGIKLKRVYQKKVLLDCLLLLLLVLVVFSRTGLNGIINRTDANFPVYPVEYFVSQLHLWNSKLALGFDSTFLFIPQLFPNSSVLAALDFVGLPLSVVNRLWFIFCLFFYGLSMYYLTSTLVTGRRRRIASLVAAVFYIFNVYTIILLANGQVTVLLTFAAMTFLLAFYIRGLDAGDKSGRKYLILFALFTTLLMASNASCAAMALFVLVIYWIFFNLTTRGKDIVNSIKFSLKALALSIILNTWWLAPTISWYILSPKQISSFLLNPQTPGVLKITSAYASLRRVIFLVGAPILPKHYTFASYFLSWPGKILLVSLISVAFVGLLVKNRYRLYFLSLILVGVFFGMGVHPPFGFAYQWLWNHFPSWQMFRSPYKFASILALSYAFLIGLATAEIFYLARERLKILRRVSDSPLPVMVLLAVAALIFINSWPMLTGNLAGYASPITIPEYYFQARQWLQAQKDNYRMFILPQESWYTRYTWAPYDMPDILWHISPKPIVRNYLGGTFNVESEAIHRTALENFYSGKIASAEALLELMGVRYVLLRKDTELDPDLGTPPLAQLKNRLGGPGRLRLVRKFGQLDLYESSFALPQIYAANNVRLIRGNARNIGKADYRIDGKIAYPALFLSSDLSQGEELFVQEHTESGSEIVLEVKHKNPTFYKLRVQAGEPFYLVFSESFDPKWIACINGHKIANHFKVNGYANAWYVSRMGDFDIEVKYQPQDIFLYSMIISGVAFMLCLLYLALNQLVFERTKRQ